ncbi:oligo-1,6-glucosidase [Arthrobacter sp. SLBN-100]|uniref:glycoside hydrolase family 13 protein n=1 Tax=Arthrobacter sp. SLBN-100 TaxID=2768450 RepID=UPI001152C4C7|nr:alpha-glucosidase [Arthrobacter sp. SLBN-100]TQJ62054.1 oligo-1,6-glucosidase [Arthrobacter sp. SLBN-100]
MTAQTDTSLLTTEPAEWWRSAVVYQIYPRSFADSDGDGIGDLRGIINHLDHIANLGVDVVWLCPIYSSPQDDNGYDISDYTAIDPIFGNLEDFDELLAGLHARGIRLIMDLVVNHTSDEHPWFVESRSSRENPKRDWYIWRDPKDGKEPNNWGSFFSGPAWEYDEGTGQYYLHLFSRKQPDLNWDNPEVRDAVYGVMNWWLDRGVDGFRMDVINFISKDPAFPDAAPGPTGFGDGMSHFSYGPRVHEYLAEMQARVFAARTGTYLTVGEMPGVTVEQASRFTDKDSGQLNMVFQFEHMDLDHVGIRWHPRELPLTDLKASLGRWQQGLQASGWNSLYWNNHDQPRVVSRFGNDSEYHYESATALATLLHLHRGTPFIYQGEELGMTNVPFDDISDFRDIETLNYYREAVEQNGNPAGPVLEAFRRKSRDNARSPMQWSAAPQAGFTTGEPWMPVNPNHTRINAEAERDNPASVYAYYQQLIAFRHDEPVVVHGDFTLLVPDDPHLYAFIRRLESQSLLVVVNVSDNAIECPSALQADTGHQVLGNYPQQSTVRGQLRPWEALVYKLGED